MGSKRIKMWAVIPAVLTAAALIAALTGAASIRSAADRVEYVQKAAYGDPAAADGISVSYNNKAYGTGQLRWTTELKSSGGKETLTVSHSYGDLGTEPQEGYTESDMITIYSQLTLSKELEDLAIKTAQDMSPNSFKILDIRLIDYMEYLPVSATYNVGNISWSAIIAFDPETEQYMRTYGVDDVLGDLFRVRVTDDMTAKIRVNRFADADGKMDVTFSDEEVNFGDNPGNAGTDPAMGYGYDGAYYIFRYGQLFDGLVDSRLEPLADGSTPYKIYRIPYKIINNSSSDKWIELDVEKITVVGEYPEGLEVLEFSVAEDNSRAMMLAAQDGRFKAIIIDFSGNGSLQTLDLCAEAEDHEVLFKDDYFVMEAFGKGYYVVYPEGNTYSVFFAPTDGKTEAAEIRRHQKWHYKPYDVSFADGRLAVASFAGELFDNKYNDQIIPGIRGDGISLAVYSRSGLEYYTRYTSTLFGINYPLISDSACSVEASQ